MLASPRPIFKGLCQVLNVMLEQCGCINPSLTRGVFNQTKYTFHTVANFRKIIELIYESDEYVWIHTIQYNTIFICIALSQQPQQIASQEQLT